MASKLGHVEHVIRWSCSCGLVCVLYYSSARSFPYSIHHRQFDRLNAFVSIPFGIHIYVHELLAPSDDDDALIKLLWSRIIVQPTRYIAQNNNSRESYTHPNHADGADTNSIGVSHRTTIHTRIGVDYCCMNKRLECRHRRRHWPTVRPNNRADRIIGHRFSRARAQAAHSTQLFLWVGARTPRVDRRIIAAHSHAHETQTSAHEMLAALRHHADAAIKSCANNSR